MATFRFRIDDSNHGIVEAPNSDMAVQKVVSGANQRGWFDPPLTREDISIEGRAFDHVTLFTETETLGF
jgi:hypothetical protein